MDSVRFYRVKIRTGSRMPTWGEHDVTQRWYERVPHHLQANGKRQRVVKAPERALRQYA
jgi:hypothetical protein